MPSCLVAGSGMGAKARCAPGVRSGSRVLLGSFAAAPGGHGILSPLPVRIDVGYYNRSAKAIPFSRAELLQAGDGLKFVERPPIDAAMDRLDLHERKLGVEISWGEGY